MKFELYGEHKAPAYERIVWDIAVEDGKMLTLFARAPGTRDDARFWQRILEITEGGLKLYPEVARRLQLPGDAAGRLKLLP